MKNNGAQEHLTQKVAKVRSLGYRNIFKVSDGKVVSLNTGKKYSPKEMIVAGRMDFENGQGSEKAVVYMLECNSGELGTLVNTSGEDSEQNLDRLISTNKIKMSNYAR